MNRNVLRWFRVFMVVVAVVLVAHAAPFAQALTGTLEGSVKDEQGGVLPGATARLSSPAMPGGPSTLVTNAQGEFRFLALPPGTYVLDVERQGFASVHDEDIPIGAGATVRRTVVLEVAGTQIGRRRGQGLADRRAGPGRLPRTSTMIGTIPGAAMPHVRRS